MQHWVCSIEEHEDGGKHYHMALKLSEQKRWRGAQEFLRNKHEIAVHFSAVHDNYYSAYRYTTKEDSNALHSDEHPNLRNAKSPRTKKCTKALREKGKGKMKTKGSDVAGTSTEKQQKRRRLSLTPVEVSEILLENNIKRDVELCALANTQKSEGKTDLSEFIITKGMKAINDLIHATWKVHGAAAAIERESVPRMSLIRKVLEAEECANGCQGRWIKCATDVLRKNGVPPYVFAAAARELLGKGRGKFRNIIIVGPANCGKTFLLRPLSKIFKTFENPATTTYALLGVEEAEMILLNDFRWSSEIIAWKDFLLLLEGQPIHFPAPKTSYAKDILLERDTPIFATSKAQIVYVGKYNSSDERETEMMAARWKVFQFTHQIPQSEQIELPSCARCFSELVMLGEDMQ